MTKNYLISKKQYLVLTENSQQSVAELNATKPEKSAVILKILCFPTVGFFIFKKPTRQTLDDQHN